MSKSQAVHRSRHLNVGEQHMDAKGVVCEHAQGGFGMLSFHYLKALIAERLGSDKANQLFVLSDQDRDLIRHVPFTPKRKPKRLAKHPVAPTGFISPNPADDGELAALSPIILCNRRRHTGLKMHFPETADGIPCSCGSAMSKPL